ncbi:hypothetical protein MRX96_023354 [Rhipicephalus microplus]
MAFLENKESDHGLLRAAAVACAPVASERVDAEVLREEAELSMHGADASKQQRDMETTAAASALFTRQSSPGHCSTNRARGRARRQGLLRQQNPHR